jgi:YVTN family beta-propeller protein
MKRTLIGAAAFACLSAAMLWATATPKAALLVLSKQDRTLAIVDPATLKVVAKIPAGNDPHEVIASADGRRAYISNYGFGRYDTISVADLVGQKALPAIQLSPLGGPHGLDFAGGELYFTAEVNKVFGRYNPATQKIDWIMGTGQDRTHMIRVAKNLDRIYTSNVNSGTISIFAKTDPPPPPGPPPSAATGRPTPPPPPRGANWEETVLKTGVGTEGFDVSPDGKELWSAASQGGTISVINLTEKKVVATLDANVNGANRLKFTPDGRYVFVSMLRPSGGGNLAIFDASTRREVKRLSVGKGAGGILMQPDGERAYVACSPDNYVAVIDLETFKETGRIDVGRNPDGMAWAVRK